MAADFIAVIEVGSERVNGIAGVKKTNGSIEVLAAVSADASSFVERGVVYNLNQAADCFTAIVRQLENILKVHIEKVYTGVGGQSLYTVHNSITRTLTSPTPISKELVESMEDQNTDAFHREGWDRLDTVPQEYKVGGFEKTDPVGIIDSRIEGHFLNIIARKELKKNLVDSFRQAKIQVAGVFIAPVLLARTILTDNEKRSGCALVDFQYDTTTIAIYQRNILRHLAVLPLGIKNVLLDIVNTFNIEETEARDLFRKYGNAYCEEAELNNDKVIALSDGSPRNRKEFNETVEARLQEIVANIWQQIAVSGFEDNQLRSGVVFTGPFCEIKNIDKAFQQYKKSEVKVRVQKTLPVPVIDSSHKLSNNSNIALSILLAGEENCAGKSLISDDIFGGVGAGEKKPDPPKEDPREKERREAAERREKEYQSKREEVHRLIEGKKFSEAQKLIKELRAGYPEKSEDVTILQTTLDNSKAATPGRFDRIKTKLGKWWGDVMKPEDNV